MKPTLQLAYAPKDEAVALTVAKSLKELGYPTKIIGKLDPSELVICFLTNETKLDELLLAQPWLKSQLQYSSFKNFRVMPLIPYHAQKEDIETLWEEGIGEVYEELFSGEFKPFGWDLDDEKLNPEFERVLEEYL